MLRYSDSTQCLEIVFSFLVFQEIKEEPKKFHNQIEILQKMYKYPQSASECAVKWIGDLDLLERPTFIVSFKYFRKFNVTQYDCAVAWRN